MAFTSATQAQIALKNLLGKSQTDTAKGPNNESESLSLIVHGDFIWIDPIDSDPATAVGAGIATSITADLVADTTSNGHAYFAQYQTGHPLAGQRVKNAIPPTFGVGYEAKPAVAGSILIPPGDDRNWVYQYQSGIFFQELTNYTAPVNISLYVYTGATLSQSNLRVNGTPNDGDIIVYNGTTEEWETAPREYVHEQLAPDTHWDVIHNLNRYPAVSVMDSGGSIVVGEITHINTDRLQLVFASAFSGKAICS